MLSPVRSTLPVMLPVAAPHSSKPRNAQLHTLPRSVVVSREKMAQPAVRGITYISAFGYAFNALALLEFTDQVGRHVASFVDCCTARLGMTRCVDFWCIDYLPCFITVGYAFQHACGAVFSRSGRGETLRCSVDVLHYLLSVTVMPLRPYCCIALLSLIK